MSDSSIQLTTFSEASTKLYLQPGAIEVTPSAAHFRDISTADIKKERNIKIAMIVGAVILLIVTIVAVSEIAQLSPIERWNYNRAGFIHLVYDYPAFAAIVPGILGAGGVVGLAVGAAVVNLENNRYLRDLSKDGAVEHELFILTSEKLEAVYTNYHLRLQPLVRKGLISEDEGRQLSGLLASYHESATKKASYESRGAAFKADLEAHPKKYPTYAKVLIQISQLEKQWVRLQKKIQDHYTQE